MTTTKRGHCCPRSAFGKVRFLGHKSPGILLGAPQNTKSPCSNYTIDRKYLVWLFTVDLKEFFEPKEL